MYDELFYKRLTQLRMAKNISARKMSVSVGQNKGYINTIENKKGFPSMEAFFEICFCLGVTPSEFFDDGQHDPVRLQAIIKDLKTLDQSQLEAVQTLIQAIKGKS